MKPTSRKRPFLNSALRSLGCVLCLWCTTNTTHAQQPKGKPHQSTPSPSPAVATTLNPAETTFVQNAWTNNNAGVKLANLALQNTEDKAVRSFANQILQSGTSANNDLNPVAKKYGIHLPPESTDFQETYQHLSKLRGTEFDQAYWKEVINDHTTEVAAYKKAHDEAKSSDLKGYVDKVEPLLESHLQAAKDAQATASKEKKSQ